MKIIISPAKQMLTNIDYPAPETVPVFIDRAQFLLDALRKMDYPQLKKLLSCSDKLAEGAYKMYASADLYKNTSAAILSYDGIQYKYMAPDVFEDRHFDYIRSRLYILSGFYGLVRPFDGIIPYRLEMQAKLETAHGKNLYEFWGSSIYDELTKDDDVIIDLASEEYSKCVSKYVKPPVRLITCVFGEEKDGKIIEKGVHVKMARGEMVRFMAENEVSSPEEMVSFDKLGFSYNKELSLENKLVFIRQHKSLKRK